MYHVVFYESERGDSPVEDFLQGLDPHTQAKAKALIGLLEEHGPQLKRPYADKLEGKIYEIRPKQARVLYFFFHGRQIVLLHGFIKKTWEVPKSEIRTATNRMEDWIARHR